MNTQIAAHAFVVLVSFVIGFQIALAAGAPWGHLTWGGRFPGRLPGRMRGVALFSVALLAAFAVTLEVRAGTIFANLTTEARGWAWVVVVYCALGVVANAATPSRQERLLWLPVVSLMLACSLVVALG
jgi:hypothetical protein